MKKYILFLLILFTVSVFDVSLALGQQDPYTQLLADRTSSYDIMNSIKLRMRELMEQNKILKAEEQETRSTYNTIQKQVVDLQNQINVLKGEAPLPSGQRLNPRPLETLQKDEDILKNEYLIKTSRISFLNGEAIDLKQRQKLRQLRLKELDYEKRQLEMELKLQRFLHEESRRKDSKEMERIGRAIKANREKTKSIAPLMEQFEQGRRAIPERVSRLEEEVRALQKDNDAFARRKELKEREVSILRDKKLLAEKQSQYSLQQKQSERDVLAREVQALEDRFKTLNAALEQSLTRQNQRRHMVDLILNVDRENQQLRGKIADIEEEIRFRQ